MTRFLHTADWQLGVEARHVAQAGQAVREARLATVQLLLQVCRREQAEFVVVAGDVCEDNGVSDELVHRLLRILEGAPAPVLLLPGNYDGLWVPQGAGREEPALVEELRSRLQAGVGGLALSRKESELLRCLEARQAAIFQEKRGAVSTGSELARLRGQVSEARQELSRLESLREAADRAASELTEVRQARESLEQRQAELSAEEQRLSTICESARLYRDQLERLCAAQAVARSTFETVDLFRQRLIGLQTTMREQTVLADALTQRQTSLERELDEALLSYARVRQRVAELQDEATRLEQRQEWARALEELGAELRGGGEPFAGPESDPSTALPELGRTHADTRRRLAECTGELQSAQVALEELRRAEGELALDRQGAVLALQAARRDLEEILSRYGAAESLLSAWREARQELDRAEGRLAEHRERAPAQEGDPEHELARSQVELDRGARRLSELHEREISCQTRLDDALGSGLHHELVQQRERVTRVERELRAAELRARSTQLLARVARAIEVELASGLAGPLACELGQHLERISAVPDRRADLDPHLVLRGPQRSLAPLPVSPEMGGAAALESAVVRAGLEALSGGTREQLALVHRLAVGRALAGSERLLVVINDPLGDTDEARQTRALELLQEFARQLQIVVLTCRPERYAGLAGVARFELA